MILVARQFDLLPIVAAAEGMPLPDPRNFAAIGWVLVSAWVLIKIADSVLNFYKRHIKQSIPSGDWVTNAQMDTLRHEVHNQLSDNRAYVHEAIHALGQRLQGMQESGDSGREGLHNRLNTLVELVHHMRGQNEGMLLAQKTSAEAAERAALGAVRAADRAEEIARRNSGQ